MRKLHFPMYTLVRCTSFSGCISWSTAHGFSDAWTDPHIMAFYLEPVFVDQLLTTKTAVFHAIHMPYGVQTVYN